MLQSNATVKLSQILKNGTLNLVDGRSTSNEGRRRTRPDMHNAAMDDLVLRAINKWPHVPACYGWLGLDSRGRWFLRDDAVQAVGPFPEGKGDRLTHDNLLAFVGRNYAADEQGQWYFQNGPQRVYVELESTPWIWRVQGDGALHAHTGHVATAKACLTDTEGHVYFSSDLGLGLVHSADVPLVAEAIERGEWTVREVDAARLPAEFDFVRSPAALAAAAL